MRAGVILLIVLAVLLAAYYMAAAGGHTQGLSFEAPDPDDLDDWTPPPLARTFADAAWPFAPRGRFDPAAVTIGAGGDKVLTNLTQPKGLGPKMQLAKLTVGAGAVAVSYPCSRDDGPECPTFDCFCAEGSAVQPLLAPACPKDFRRRLTAAGACSARSRSGGKIALYPDTRGILVRNIGLQAAEVAVE